MATLVDGKEGRITMTKENLFITIKKQENIENKVAVTINCKVEGLELRQESKAELYINYVAEEEFIIEEKSTSFDFPPIELEGEDKEHIIYAIIETSSKPIHSNTIQFPEKELEQEEAIESEYTNVEFSEEIEEPSTNEYEHTSNTDNMEDEGSKKQGSDFSGWRWVRVVRRLDFSLLLIVDVMPKDIEVDFTVVIDEEKPKGYKILETDDGRVELPLSFVDNAKRTHEVVVLFEGQSPWGMIVFSGSTE